MGYVRYQLYELSSRLHRLHRLRRRDSYICRSICCICLIGFLHMYILHHYNKSMYLVYVQYSIHWQSWHNNPHAHDPYPVLGHSSFGVQCLLQVHHQLSIHFDNKHKWHWPLLHSSMYQNNPRAKKNFSQVIYPGEYLFYLVNIISTCFAEIDLSNVGFFEFFETNGTIGCIQRTTTE